MTKPKVLFVDIETSPIIAHVWALWDQNVGLNQIQTDWNILSWAAKWQGEAKVMYQDLRHSKSLEDDKKLLKTIWKLLDEADIVIWQNGRRFDHKKLNARFILNGMKPPSSYKQIDTLEIAKKYFAFTSNKLEYMSDKLCTKYKKLQHKKFPGHEMWRECLAHNMEAWEEMEKYNKHDVLALEELYTKMSPWENSVNFNLYIDDLAPVCKCGSKEFHKRGFTVLTHGKYQKYHCNKCGSETRSKENLLSPEKKKSLRVQVPR